MFEELPEIAVPKAIGFYVLVSIGRPFGFLTTLTLMNFTLHRGRMVRIAMALVFAGPIVMANQGVLYDVYIQNSFLDRFLMPSKELVLGLLLGLIASLPFYAFKYAGSIVDNYRGEGSNGIPFEGGERVTTSGLLFYLILFMVFLSQDGLWRLFEVFYSSYEIWPVETYFPPISGDAALVVIAAISQTFLLMIQVGLPLLLLIFLTEMFLMIGSRLAHKFGLNNINFLAKNVAFVFLLPIYAVFVIHTADSAVVQVWSASEMLGKIFE